MSTMKFYLVMNYYGADIPLVQQAAQEHNVRLLAVNGLAFEDIPAEQCGFREGPADYLFFLESDSQQEAFTRLFKRVRMRIAQLTIAQLTEDDEKGR